MTKISSNNDMFAKGCGPARGASTASANRESKKITQTAVRNKRTKIYSKEETETVDVVKSLFKLRNEPYVPRIVSGPGRKLTKESTISHRVAASMRNFNKIKNKKAKTASRGQRERVYEHVVNVKTSAYNNTGQSVVNESYLLDSVCPHHVLLERQMDGRSIHEKYVTSKLSPAAKPWVPTVPQPVPVVDENPKDFAKSKRLKREEEKVKKLEREVQNLRHKNKVKSEALAKANSARRETKPPVINETGMSLVNSPAMSLFSSLVDVEKTSSRSLTTFLALESGGFLKNIKNPHEIVREVVISLVALETGKSVKEIRRLYRKKVRSGASESVNQVYEEMFSTMLVFNPGVVVNRYPTMWETYLRNDPELLTESLHVPEDGPSTLLRSAIFAQKIAVLCVTLIDAPTWTDVMFEIGKFISYTADAATIHRFINGKTDGTKKIEKFIKDRFESLVLRHNGVKDTTSVRPVLDRLSVSLDGTCSISPEAKKESKKSTLPVVEEETIEFEYTEGSRDPLARPPSPTPTIVEIPPRTSRVKNESDAITTNPFAMLRSGIDVLRTVARQGIGLEEKIKEIPILELLDEVTALIVFFTIAPPTPVGRGMKGKLPPSDELLPPSYLYKEVLNRAFNVHKTDMISIISRICTVIDTTLMISATLWDGVDYSVLVNPLDVQTRLARLAGYQNGYESGCLDVMRKDDPNVPSTDDYERDVKKLVEDLHSLIRNKAVKPAAMGTFVGFLTRATQLNTVITMAVRSRTEKDMPYMIGLYGKPGVGKSMCAEVYIRVLSLAYDTPIKPSDIWNCSPDPNGWHTGATSSKKVLQVTEHDNIVVKGDSKDVFFDTARLCDTLPSQFNMPDLEKKGITWNFLIGGVFACNQKDFGLARVRDPGASARRVDFYEISVKPECGMKSEHGDHLVPDPDKCGTVWNQYDNKWVPNEDTYLIHPYTIVTMDKVGDDSGTGRKFMTRYLTDKPLTMPQWRKWMYDRARKKLAASRKFNSGLNDTRAQTLCLRCANPFPSCLCRVRGDAFCPSVIPDPPPASGMWWGRAFNEIAHGIARLTLPRASESDLVTRRGKDIPEAPSDLSEAVLPELEELPTADVPPILNENDVQPRSVKTQVLKAALWPDGTPPEGETRIPCSATVIARRVASKGMGSMMTYPFNLYTTFCVGAASIWAGFIPCFILTSFMLTMTFSVEDISARIARRLFPDAKAAPAGRYWDTSYADLAVFIGVMGAVSACVYTRRSRDTAVADSAHHVSTRKRQEPVVYVEPGDSVSEMSAPQVGDQGFEPKTAESLVRKAKGPDIWLPRKTIDMNLRVPHSIRTMTSEHISSCIAQNTVTLSNWDSTTRTTSGRVRAIFMTPNVLLLPVHKDEVRVNSTYALTFDIGKSLTVIDKIHRISYNGEETDMCFALIGTRYPYRSIHRLLEHDIHSHYASLGEDPAEVGEASLHTPGRVMKCFASYTRIYTETRSSYGYKCEQTAMTHSGDCGSPLITTENPALIGFHVSRILDSTTTYASIVDRESWTTFLASCTKNENESIMFENVFFDNKIPTCPRVKTDEPSPRVCTRFIRASNTGPECTATPPCVMVFGHDASTRATARSEVYITPLSPYLETNGVPRLHGPPPLNSNRAAAQALIYGARGAYPRGKGVNDALISHYVNGLVPKMRALGMKPRMLSYDEALRGIPDNNFVKPMSLNKACGGGCPGKKYTRVIKSRFPDEEEAGMELPEFDDISVAIGPVPASSHSVGTHHAVIDYPDLVPSCTPELKKEIIHIFRSWDNSTTCNTIVQAAIKDDPTLLSKIESGNGSGRTVTSQSMAHHVAQTMIFGDIIGMLRAIPLTSRHYEGVSYQSQDWHDIAYDHMCMDGADVTFLDADTKKMDLSFNSQELEATTEVLARLAEALGASLDHISYIRKCGMELAVPFLNLYGEVLWMALNTSGNKLTITQNNIAGVQLRIREAYVALKLILRRLLDPRTLTSTILQDVRDEMNDLTEEECSELLADFNQNVKLGSIGDDSLMSCILKGFNMSFVTLWFLCKGVTITSSEKGTAVEDGLELFELSCCQRGFVWSDDFDRIVGPLSLKSLSRSLHCMLPSKESPSVVERNIMRTVLEELVLHGESVFNDMKMRLLNACMEADRMHIHAKALSGSYAHYLAVMRKRNPTTLSAEEIRDARNRFYHGMVKKGLVDPQDARATHGLERLPAMTFHQGISRHSVDEIGAEDETDITPPSELKCVSNQNQENNIEFVTPSSTADVMAVAATSSPAAGTVKTHDTPMTVQTRPVRLKTFSWSVGSVLNSVFDPWSLLMANPVIRNKMEFFRFFRGKIHIKVLIDGNQFHSGEVWLGYLPLPLHDEMTEYEPTSEADLVEFSQRPHIVLSPRESQGGEMILPFIFNRDYVDLLSDEMTQLGRLYMRTIVPLAMANGGDQPCTITVMAHFADLELSMPTTHSLPLLKVVNESALNTRMETGFVKATKDVHNLSLQDRSDLSTDPASMWSERQDLSFASLANRESFIGSFNWSSTTPHDIPLASFRCSPFHGLIEGAAPNQEHHVTPSCWVSLPFTWWRGTCEYRFEVVCSPNHRGKLLFVWDPLYTRTNGEYNKNYMVVMDIGEKTSHVAKIGWGQSSPFLPTVTTMAQISNQTAGEYSTPSPYANGVLTMSVFSPLMIPSQDAESSVTINVYQRMSRDIELALLREPLVGMSPQKNNVKEGAAIIRPVDPPVQTTVANPTLAVTRVVDICEEPLLLAFRPTTRASTLPAPYTNYFDQTMPSTFSDVNMDKLISDVYEPLSLARDIPLAEDYPYVFRLRGFVQGGGPVKLTTINTPVPIEIDAALTGITATTDLVLQPLNNGLRFQRDLILSSTTRFEVSKAILRIPKWLRTTVKHPPELPNFIDLQPFLNFYEPNGSAIGPLSTNQIPVGRTNVYFRIRVNPEHVLLSNVVLSYIATSTGNPIIMNSSRDGNCVLPPTGSDRRHHAFSYSTDNVFYVPATSTFTATQLTWLKADTAAVRTAVKGLPVLVTNQSDLDQTSIMHGPSMIANKSGDHFHELHRDITQCLEMRNVHSMAVLAATNGNTVLKVPYFPFQYRVRLNTDNSVDRFTPNMFEYFVRAFITFKGSMNIEMTFEHGAGLVHPSFARATRTDNTSVVSLASINFPGVLYSFRSADHYNPRLDPSLKVTVPWNNPTRFGFARSTDPQNHSAHALRVDLGFQPTARVVTSYSVGEDFTLGHFLCTPILRVS